MAHAETDAEFLDRLEATPRYNPAYRTLVSDRLFALARRGAAAIADDQCKKEPELPHQDRRYNNAERLFGDE